jgi:heme o synthase
MQAQFSDSEVTIQPTWREYIELVKPGMVFMLVTSGLAAMFIAGAGLPSVTSVIAGVVGLMLGAAGACALNSYLETDLDALMIRTRNRPLPTQKMHPGQALHFGLGLVALSSIVLLVGSSWAATLLNAAGIFLYVVVYTKWLKRRSIFSTFVGGIAGAFPVLVGWAAVTGGLSIEALVIFGIVLYWTPAHYWSIALIHRSEYVKAALPVLPVIQGPNATRLQIGRYSVLVVILTLIPVGMGLLDRYYAIAALALGIYYIFHAVQMHLTPGLLTTQRYYKHSLLYMSLLLFAMIADRAIL